MSKRCDSRCHEARTPRCSCWCEGEYHGIGSSEARRRMVEDLGAGVLYSGGRDPRRQPLELGPLFAHESQVRARVRATFAAAADVLRRAGLLR